MALKYLLYLPLLAPFILSAPLEERDTGYEGTTNWECAHYGWGARWIPIESGRADHLDFRSAVSLLCGDFYDQINKDKDGTLASELATSTATSDRVKEDGGGKKVGFSDGTEGHLTLTWKRTTGWPDPSDTSAWTDQDPHEYCVRSVMLLADWDKKEGKIGDPWGSSCYGKVNKDTIGGSFGFQNDLFNATAVVA
ncbi:hypothetical protein BDV96DRAFT_655854 [Lophiotrema nucula]|uniref:Uncharacterized protein n=1 Tax=Lophiotrema nucula TaxID=690887 RepID=A0A6A5YE94_9PLEO|nr:hypothetical protein BDV96DRAFT_655854 [Lophiotrema nucula]